MSISLVSSYGSILILLLAGSAGSSLAQTETIAPSKLNESPLIYNGAEVVVRGYLTIGPQAHSIYESKRLKLEFGRRWELDKDFDPKDYRKYCLTIANPDFLFERRAVLSGKMVVVKGKFINDYMSGRVDFGACPLPTAIIIDEDDFKVRYPEIFPTSHP